MEEENALIEEYQSFFESFMQDKVGNFLVVPKYPCYFQNNRRINSK